MISKIISQSSDQMPHHGQIIGSDLKSFNWSLSWIIPAKKTRFFNYSPIMFNWMNKIVAIGRRTKTKDSEIKLKQG